MTTTAATTHIYDATPITLEGGSEAFPVGANVVGEGGREYQFHYFRTPVVRDLNDSYVRVGEVRLAEVSTGKLYEGFTPVRIPRTRTDIWFHSAIPVSIDLNEPRERAYGPSISAHTMDHKYVSFYTDSSKANQAFDASVRDDFKALVAAHPEVVAPSSHSEMREAYLRIARNFKSYHFSNRLNYIDEYVAVGGDKAELVDTMLASLRAELMDER